MSKNSKEKSQNLNLILSNIQMSKSLKSPTTEEVWPLKLRNPLEKINEKD
jgi:hypothetical protein